MLLTAVSAMLLAGASSSAAHAAPAADPSIANGAAQHALDAARVRWHAAHIHDYHFIVERVCFCAPSFRGPATIVVRNDVPLAPPASFSNVATIPKLHAIVQKAIDDRVARLTVAYDARGVPRSIAIDGSLAIADDEITYHVTGFTADHRRYPARGDVALRSPASAHAAAAAVGLTLPATQTSGATRLAIARDYSSRLLIAYHRTGGFAGLDDRLSVTISGLAIHTGRDGATDVFQLSAADLTELERVLDAANFPALKKSYLPRFPVSDGFTYTLTHSNRTVVTADGAVPAALEQPIAVLNGLLGGR